MRAVSLVVLYGLCLNVPAQSTAILSSCTGAVTGSDTNQANASSVRRPVTSGLNFTHNHTVAVPKHVFQKNVSDLLDEDEDDDDLVANTGQDFNRMSLRPSAPQNWITQVISTLTPLPDNLGIACQRDTQTYLQELSNFTHWAVRMMDASAKFPHGILMGNIRSMGDFDECLWTKTDQEIEPKYCLASVYNLDVKNTYPVYDKLQEIVRTMTIGRMNMETYETTMGTIPMQRSGRIEWAMCIPATCSPVDVEIMLNAAGKRIFPELDIRATVHSKDCYTNSQPQGFSLRDKLILLSMMVIVSLVVVGTLRDQSDGNNNDNQDEEKPLSVKILDAFSLKRSWKNLTDFSPSRSSRQIECLDGLRGISSLWVVMGHQALLASSSPYSDKVTFFKTQQYTILMILWNFFLPVDTFLVIGGLVRCYNLMPGLEKRTVNHWKSAITRYLRLTPALLVVIGLYVSVMYRISNGPLWNRHVGENKVACEWNWWKTVFYVNNYIYNEREGYHLCLLQSWYTSVDMQLYLLAPLLIVPLWRNPKLGMTLLITVAGIATAVEYATIVLNKLPGLPITMHSDDIAILTYVRTFYFVSHTRAMPYLIGIATGYLMHRYKSITMSKTMLSTGWPLAMLGLFWPLFGSLGYLAVDYPLGSWRHAYFGAFHKTVWAVAISWIIVACHNGYGGPVNAFLSSRVLKFLSRISYSVFLLHLGILVCFTGYLRVPKHTDFPSIMKEMVGELSVVIILSIILHLSVEAPFAELSQIVFRKTKREVKKLK
ncbi:nose resistant to fluoxetine protein 6-like [Neodiprion fabricii]|uniref:nose resistant to fluoxetine protein 6-like n=1 Tax=Neodiprion fabricii TaxID=2872261 RepID=UPI001ED92197|nr:nose resistant to fluoxetine protein 6-like [Neodiprion fabricii]